METEQLAPQFSIIINDTRYETRFIKEEVIILENDRTAKSIFFKYEEKKRAIFLDDRKRLYLLLTIGGGVHLIRFNLTLKVYWEGGLVTQTINLTLMVYKEGGGG